MPTSQTLLDALDRLRGTGPEFHEFLANHGPMASEALIRMGAEDAVPGWVDGYRKALDAAPEPVRGGIDPESWREHLGDERLIGDWLVAMRREAAEMPWPELLVRWWERLLPGMAASATHAVIRTGHAVRSLREAGESPDPLLVDELAQGLAFWAARYLPVPGAPTLTGPDRAIDAAARLPRLDPDTPSEGDGIMGRLVPLARLDGFPAALDGWRAPTDPDAALDDLVAAGSRVICAREDSGIAFCHTVTGPAAVRIVLPMLPERLHRPSVATAWQVVGGIISALATPRILAESADPDEAPAADLVGAAVEHGDEHAIKLAEAAIREHARTGDDAVLVAAARYRRRAPRPDF